MTQQAEPRRHTRRARTYGLGLALASIAAIAFAVFAGRGANAGVAAGTMVLDADAGTAGVQSSRTVASGQFVIAIDISEAVQQYQGFQWQIAFDAAVLSPIGGTSNDDGNTVWDAAPSGFTLCAPPSEDASAPAGTTWFGLGAGCVGLAPSTFTGQVAQVTLECDVTDGSSTAVSFVTTGQTEFGTTMLATGGAVLPTNLGDPITITCGEGAPPTATPTNTPEAPTATPTNTPEAPTATPTTTPEAPTATPTNTPEGPTATPTNTPEAPTATPTNTPEGPTATPTNTPEGPTATPTNTPEAPTATPTNTPEAPTATPTNTPEGPTATPTNTVMPTATPVPGECLTLGQKISRIIGIVKRLGAEEGDHDYKAKYDVNGDGVIDVDDLIEVATTPLCPRGKAKGPENHPLLD